MIRFGIVGAGLRGRMYQEALADVPDVEVVAFAEPSERVATLTREATGLPVVTSAIELLSRHELDAVVVATPDFAHREAAVAVASAGKHLLLEKPLAMTLDDAYAIRDAVVAGGAICLVGFENRWNPHVVSAKRIIDAGTVGTHITSSATLSNSWFVPTQMLSWAAKSSPAWFLMPHTVDMLLWFSGRTPVSVSAVASSGILKAKGIDTQDVVHALIAFDDGTTASLTSAWTLPDGTDAIVDFHFQFIGTDGSISGDPIHQGLDVATDRLRTQGTLSGRIGTSQVGAPVWMAQEFAANLVQGKPTGPGVEQGVLV
ncbi:MAG TPA: Gfo/Idh/MocA family oxidoreductase, partial [Thermomicrobiales bacterium]|nr:Gfo/Idh/MocA family oxidoreductase [Thermomicrobiales bacterium]